MTIANQEQHEHWNSGDDADHWVRYRQRYEAMLGPFTEMITSGAGLVAGDRAIDIGCGCGQTTLKAAAIVDPGAVLGVDLSAPMLAQARIDAAAAGTRNVEFMEADAQVHPFEPGSFDAVISRFGIMFFADPVAAFANIRAALVPDGRLAFVCWQDRDANEWLRVPAGALAQHVALPAPPQRGAPGMLAFVDPDRVRSVLEDAGWRDVDVSSRHTRILAGGGSTLDDAVEFFRTGAIGRVALAGADETSAAAAISAVRDALAPYAGADGVRLVAAVWLVTARA